MLLEVLSKCCGHPELSPQLDPGGRGARKGKKESVASVAPIPHSTDSKWKKLVLYQDLPVFWKFCKPWEEEFFKNTIPKCHFNECVRLLYGDVS